MVFFSTHSYPVHLPLEVAPTSFPRFLRGRPLHECATERWEGTELVTFLTLCIHVGRSLNLAASSLAPDASNSLDERPMMGRDASDTEDGSF